VAGYVKPLLPEGQPTPYLYPVSTIVPALSAWKVVGRLIGRGWTNAINTGVYGMAVALFFTLLTFAIGEMVKRSMRFQYDGPMDAIVGMFGIVLEYGALLLTLRDLDLLEVVLGAAPDVVPATLPEARVARAAGQSYPVLAAAKGQRAQGLVLRDLTAEQLARLDYYEAPYDYSRVAAQTDVGPADVYRPPAAQEEQAAKDWSLDAWQAEFGPLMREAAVEIMEGFGHVDPALIAARMQVIRTRAQQRVNARARVTPTRLRRCSEYMTSFVALTELPDGIEGVGGVEGEAEDIRSMVVSFQALQDALASGEAENGPLVMSALWLGLHRDRLRGSG